MNVKILNRYYRMHWVDPDELPESYGECLPVSKVIRICNNLHPDDMVDVILHEIAHAIWHGMDLEEHATEERIVHAMAIGLASVMTENKPLRDYLNRLYETEHRFTAQLP